MSNVKITEDHIGRLLDRSLVEEIKLGAKTTVVHVTLPNGFELVESSSCVDPANYDHALGVSICMKRIKDKIWELEGYWLQKKVDEDNEAS